MIKENSIENFDTCLHCIRKCKKESICNKFNLKPEYVELKKKVLLTEDRKEKLKSYFKTNMHKYIVVQNDFHEQSNFRLYYSIDQDKFLRKNIGSFIENKIGNWIEIPFDMSKYYYLKSNYTVIGTSENTALFNKLCDEAFDSFWKLHATKENITNTKVLTAARKLF
jgi:hypothetical protein